MYPDISDPNFYSKILQKKEFYDNKIENVMKKIYCYEPQQRFLANYLAPKTPYDNILVFHEVGTGKTFVSIAIAEKNKSFAFVFAKNESLLASYKEQLIFGCEKYGSEKNIPDTYSFHTYKDFDIFSKGFPEDSVVIVDEAHNIISDNSVEKFTTCIDNSKNIKIVLLSGTPMYDEVGQIFDLLNFLVPPNIRVSGTDGLVRKNGLTPTGIETLKFMGKGIISYLKIDKKTFAKQRTINLALEMSDFQAKGYRELNSKISALQMNKVAASMIVYPNYISHVKEISGNFLLHENLKSHSIKLYTLLNKLKTTHGKSIVYSNFVSKSCGVNLIKLVFDYNKIKYILISEDTKNKKETVNTFSNSKNPKEILLCSSIISEGLNTKGVYNVHILDPHWNDSRIQQVIGRAIRKNSHLGNPKAIVNVFKYIAIIQGIQTIDQYKYQISRNKKIGIDEATEILNSIAVDCWLNKSRNGPVTCIFEPKQLKLDYSTFEIDDVKYSFIKKQIVKLFQNLENYLRLDYIESKIEDNLVCQEELKSTLKRMRDEEFTFKGPLGISGYLISTANFVIFSMKSEKFKSNINSKTLQFDLNYLNVKNVELVKKKTATVIEKHKITIEYFENFAQDKPLFGHFINKYGEKDNHLRILDFTEIDPTEEDKRKLSTGKKLSIHSKEELVELMQKLNLEISNSFYKKKNLIEIITNELINKKLIF